MTQDAFDRQVADALAAIDAGRLSGLDQLYDLMSGSVYELSRLVTGSRRAAEDATVHTFVRVWSSTGLRSSDATGARWVLELACDSAHAHAAPVSRSQAV